MINLILCQNNYRFVVIDGNEKMYRLICGSDNTIEERVQGEPNRKKICIRDPVRGNQHRKASKFCSEHTSNTSEKTTVQEPIEYKRITRSISALTETVTSGQGCKKEENIDRFHSRTAGMLYFFRPCGVRLSHWEMYTAESLSHVFMCLVDLFGDNLDELFGIVYDRACGLHPFIKRLAAEGNDVAIKLCNLAYIVDIFHAEKHSLRKCVVGDPRCEYDPHLQKFSYV